MNIYLQYTMIVLVFAFSVWYVAKLIKDSFFDKNKGDKGCGSNGCGCS